MQLRGRRPPPVEGLGPEALEDRLRQHGSECGGKTGRVGRAEMKFRMFALKEYKTSLWTQK